LRDGVHFRHPKIDDLDLGAINYAEYWQLSDSGPVQRAARWAFERKEEDAEAASFVQWLQANGIISEGSYDVTMPTVDDGPAEWNEVEPRKPTPRRPRALPTESPTAVPTNEPTARPTAARSRPVAVKPKRTEAPVSEAGGESDSVDDAQRPTSEGAERAQLVEAIRRGYRSLELVLAKKLSSPELELILDTLRIGPLEASFAAAPLDVLSTLARRIDAAVSLAKHRPSAVEPSEGGKELAESISRQQHQINELQLQLHRVSAGGADQSVLYTAVSIGSMGLLGIALFAIIGCRHTGRRREVRRSPLNV
jgi:hypothetical protein